MISKILKLVLVFLSIGYVIFQALSFEYLSSGLGVLSFVLLIILYSIKTKKKNIFFFLSLIIFSFAKLLSFAFLFTPEVKPDGVDYPYYTSNVLYIVFYMLLTVKILNDLNVWKVVSKYTIATIVLILMDVFCIYTFAVTTEDVLTDYQYILELMYNIAIMVLLSFAVINYMHRNDNKSLLFLAGSTSIFFSEIIQFAYFYILEYNNLLGLIYSLFLVLAFLFFYLQSQLEYSNANDIFHVSNK